MLHLQNITDESLQLVAENYPKLEFLNLTRYVIAYMSIGNWIFLKTN